MRVQHVGQAVAFCALALYFAFLVAVGRPVAADPNCYGPVQETDTLWEIARRLSPDISISPQRMMIALLRANPHAFYSDNVNALNAGSTLCFDISDAQATNNRTAVALVSRHNREWMSGLRAAADRAFQEPPSTSSDRGVNQSKALQDGGEVSAEGTPLPSAVGPGALAPETEPSEAWYHEVNQRLDAAETGIERLHPNKADAGVLDELERIKSRLNRIEDRIQGLSNLPTATPEVRAIPADRSEPRRDRCRNSLSAYPLSKRR